MTEIEIPYGLDMGGAALWQAVSKDHPQLNEVQKVQLLEACRMKDRLDRMNLILTGDASTWATLVIDLSGEVYDVRINGVVSKANETANAMKQLLAAMRLPDAVSGKVPQYRGPRGAQAPTVAGGVGKAPSSLDARRAKMEAARKAAGDG